MGRETKQPEGLTAGQYAALEIFDAVFQQAVATHGLDETLGAEIAQKERPAIVPALYLLLQEVFGKEAVEAHPAGMQKRLDAAAAELEERGITYPTERPAATREEAESFLRFRSQLIARVVGAMLHDREGFGLFLFDREKAGHLVWVSNSEREDMVGSLKKWIEHAEGSA